MSKEELIADIKLTNNGYLFVATYAQVELAKQHPEIFRVFGVGMNGNPRISLKGK